MTHRTRPRNPGPGSPVRQETRITSGNGHGGRRSGTGRPRRGGGHRNNLLGTSSASLARKYAEEAVRTVQYNTLGKRNLAKEGQAVRHRMPGAVPTQ